MKITILGCGCSGGVPLIGNVWGACDPSEPRNHRTCVSILVEEGGQTLLVDTSPDMREQLLRVRLRAVDAILYTHEHADHTHGIDNIRSPNWLMGKPVPLYADQHTMDDLKQRFSYIFDDQRPARAQFYLPAVETHIIGKAPLTFGPITVKAFLQPHGKINSLGFRFNDFGYSTDVADLTDEAVDILKGVKVWVVDGVRERPHHTHANVDTALEWIERVKPERAYLTHMDQTLDYATLKARLPDNVEPCYDGLVIECP
ncbi:MAG: MBL fold metallo-hydrolase [Alphaproteobacteria bacterium]|nr:MBL fold metallo-hydrolase [Alphaproteobacteria bacterium]